MLLSRSSILSLWKNHEFVRESCRIRTWKVHASSLYCGIGGKLDLLLQRTAWRLQQIIAMFLASTQSKSTAKTRVSPTQGLGFRVYGFRV